MNLFLELLAANSISTAIIVYFTYNALKRFANRVDDMEDKQSAIIAGLKSALNGKFEDYYEKGLERARKDRDRLNNGVKF